MVILSILIFVGAMIAAVAAMAVTVVPAMPRIAEVLRVGFGLSPELPPLPPRRATAERRVRVMRSGVAAEWRAAA